MYYCDGGIYKYEEMGEEMIDGGLIDDLMVYVYYFMVCFFVFGMDLDFDGVWGGVRWLFWVSSFGLFLMGCFCGFFGWIELWCLMRCF